MSVGDCSGPSTKIETRDSLALTVPESNTTRLPTNETSGLGVPSISGKPKSNPAGALTIRSSPPGLWPRERRNGLPLGQVRWDPLTEKSTLFGNAIEDAVETVKAPPA